MEDNNYSKQKYSLEERTEVFAIMIIKFVKSLRLTFYNTNILSQLLKSGTSIGANYREANGAESPKDFIHKIAICKKEAKESEYWLKLLSQASPESSDAGLKILCETNELIKIFAKIYTSSKLKIKN
jgi:four helix bundle protein